MDKTTPIINIKLIVNTVRDTDGNLLQGSPQFYSTPSKNFIEHMLDKEQEIPTILCSRNHNGCATPVTDLQNHNGHVPTFSDEDELLQYCKQILNDARQILLKLGVKVEVDGDTESDGKAMVGSENLGPVLAGFCMLCGNSEDETSTIGANQEGIALCETCYISYKENDNDLPW